MLNVAFIFLSQLLLFGSFTEDETKSQFGQSSKDTKKRGLKELQVDLTGPVQESSSGSFDELSIQFGSEPSIQFGTVEAPKVSVSSDIQKNNEDRTVDPANNFMGVDLKQNGDVYQPVHSYSNGSKETNKIDLDFPFLHVSRDKDAALNESRTLSSRTLDGVSSKGVNLNGTSRPELYDGPVVAFASLLPRGLINSGNLCFLNATLQALLACSPFVQLLLEIRTNNVPKVDMDALNLIFIHDVSLFEIRFSYLQTNIIRFVKFLDWIPHSSGIFEVH